MAYEMVMPYHLHMPSYFLETFTEYPYTMINKKDQCTSALIFSLERKTRLELATLTLARLCSTN